MSLRDDLRQAFADLCVLYELALASDGSLDPRVSCERFLATLMARKGFVFGSVWLRERVLPHRRTAAAGERLVLFHGAPRAHVGTRETRGDEPPWITLRAEGAFSALTGDPRLGSPSTEAALDPGAFAVLPLGELGFVKLFALGHTAPVAAMELNQLGAATDRFASTLEGCLAHERLRLEVAERERAERERSLAQAQLEQARKLEAIGRLAGGVAHDFNNLLVVVLGNAELLLREVPSQSPWRDGLESIATAARRAAELTRQLLSFSRKDPGRRSPLAIDALIVEAVDLLRRTLDPKIHIEHSPGAEDSAVTGNAAQLHTVLLNLALNARDAMPHGGTLRLASELVPPPTGAATPPGSPGWVRVRVADTGEGMEPAVLAHAFEPFFTTKAPGRGTGLGLAAAYGIISAHGGRLDITSSPGAGTTVDVLLPTVTAVAPPPSSPAPPPRLGKGTVLLVDDDELTRSTMAEMLRYLGYAVVAVDGGRAALACCDSARDPACCVLLDLRMPDLDGVETLRLLRERGVHAPVLVVSGLGDYGNERELTELGVTRVLQKPVSLKQLAAELEGVDGGHRC